MKLRYFALSILAVSVLVIGGLSMASNRTEPKSYYRLYPYQDSMTLMSGDRLVKRLPYDSSLLSLTVELDNQ